MTEFELIMKRLDDRGIMPLRVPSLKPTEEGLRRIGFFESALYRKILRDPKSSIVVAGTNGKGSVCATLERLIASTGHTVALYTSPHLVDATERIRFTEKNISKDKFCEHYRKIMELTQGLQLSHFEVLTLLAVHFFMTVIPDYLIFEVGMGGIWDATNAIPHGTAVIAKIGFDHERFLGSTVQEITRNKLGIVRKFNGIANTKVIHLPLPQECESLVNEIQKSVPSDWRKAHTLEYEVISGDPPVWKVQYNGYHSPLSLMGHRAVENSSLAWQVFLELGFNSNHLGELAKVRWPGRMEMLSYKNRKLYLSGDHNPQGVDSLIEILRHFKYGGLKILFGMGKEKNKQMISKIFSIPRSQIHLTVSPFMGLSDFGEYQNMARWSVADPIVALDRLCEEANTDDVILITGSLYLVGKIRGHICDDQQTIV